MSIEAVVSIGLALIGLLITWSVWVSVTVFKHEQEIALLKQQLALMEKQMELMEEVKRVLIDIRLQFRHEQSLGSY